MHRFIHIFRSTDMLEKILEKWDAILLNIKEEHDVTDVSYKTWLLPLKPYSVDKHILTILVPDALFLEYVKKKYEFLLKVTIEELTGISCEITFIPKDSIKEEEPEILSQSYDMDCSMTLRIRQSAMPRLRSRLEKVETARTLDEEEGNE